ncbi:hypothetical protein RMCBS344292_12531 [Rhizopus microsporus]|nr:hypothetical protein RMCBS344292_12531 [Rhizopus microsporus]
MATTTKSSIQDWVQKIHFENKVDVSLQMSSESESIKIEVDDIPSLSQSAGQDSYLQSILSSKSTTSSISVGNSCTGDKASCECYKCQRQRRRAGHRLDNTRNNTKPAPYTPLPKQEAQPKRSNTLPTSAATTKRSNTLRKTPTLKSYEKHMPKPTYSQQESIYRFKSNDRKDDNKQNNREQERPWSVIGSSDTKDNYTISWKDEGTGDDLLTPLVTFQTIFESVDKNEGLSDILEQKAKELKDKKLKVQEPEPTEQLPPRRPDCLTLSYRQGPKHNPLTLYHTMKMNKESERLNAYGIAFNHCIQSNSGLKDWIKKPKAPPPVREGSKLIQTAHQKPKRSLFSTLRKGHKMSNHSEEQLMFWASTDQLSQKKKSTETLNQPTDILLAAQALLPNQQGSITIEPNQKAPYDHIDVPGKPRVMDDVNNSISSTESNTSNKIVNKSGRLFSSLSRKASLKSYSSDTSPSIKSLEKVDE